jgi:hypothetical protein
MSDRSSASAATASQACTFSASIAAQRAADIDEHAAACSGGAVSHSCVARAATRGSLVLSASLTSAR